MCTFVFSTSFSYIGGFNCIVTQARHVAFPINSQASGYKKETISFEKVKILTSSFGNLHVKVEKKRKEKNYTRTLYRHENVKVDVKGWGQFYCNNTYTESNPRCSLWFVVEGAPTLRKEGSNLTLKLIKHDQGIKEQTPIHVGVNMTLVLTSPYLW